MLQVLHPALGQTFHEPRYTPKAPPTAPALRRQIVHLIRNITKTPKITDTLETQQNNNTIYHPKNGRSSAQSHINEDKDRRSPCPFPQKRNSDTRIFSTGKENKNVYNEKAKGVLEKQIGSLPVGSIRRLPLRVQRQTTSASQNAQRKQPRGLNLKLDNNGPNQSQSSSENRDSAKTNSCEIKGHAIPSSRNYIGTQKQRMEMHKRAQKISASLTEFKRRMVNQNKVYPVGGHDADKYQMFSSIPTPQPPQSPKPQIKLLSRKQSNSYALAHESLNNESKENTDLSPRIRYRFSGKEPEKQIHPVETYVVVQNQRERIRGQIDEPIALTMHNLSMHEMFLEMDAKEIRSEHRANNTRILNWLKSVKNCVLRPHRIVRFNVQSSANSSSAEGSSIDSSCSF
ncbi:hypothetical protein SNE40_012973 [Patella caerulea]|uniref:Uncharacterized protein n=1 Tax=Patella caerulea TaxID=87958 RepID=A0AAN8JMM7_PATCE